MTQLECCSDGDNVYSIMEFMDGGELYDLIGEDTGESVLCCKGCISMPPGTYGSSVMRCSSFSCRSVMTCDRCENYDGVLSHICIS